MHLEKTFNRLVLLIGIVFSIRFWPFLLGKTLIFGDTFSYFVPGKLFTASSLREGILPLWNPYLLGGISWIGDINQSLFSFSTLFFTFLEPVLALNFTILLYLSIGFFGMFVLVQNLTKKTHFSILAAVLWMFSGQVSATLGNPSILQTLTWFPWIVLGNLIPEKKKGFVITVFAVCMGIFGGYPQILPFAILVAVCTAFMERIDWKSLFLWWGGVLILSCVLTSFVTIPFLQTLQHSTRMLQSQTQAGEGTLHPIDLISIFLPNIFVHEVAGIKWGPQWNSMSHVVLFVPWIFIWIAATNQPELKGKRRLRWMLLLSSGAILLAMTHFVAYIPFFRFSRGPSHILSMLTITIPLAAAFLLEATSTNKQEKPTRFLRIGIIFCFLLSALTFLAWHRFPEMWTYLDQLLHHKLSQSGFHTIARDYRIGMNILLIIVFHSIISVLTLIAFTNKKMTLFILLIALECHVATANALFFAPASVYPTWNKIQQRRADYTQKIGNKLVFFTNGNASYTDFASYADALTVRAPFSDSFVDEQELTTFAHLRSMQETLTPNWNMVYRVQALNGYVSLFPQHVDQAFRAPGTEPLLNSLPPLATTSAQLREWNVSYVVVDPWYPNGARFSEKDLFTMFGRANVYSFKRTD